MYELLGYSRKQGEYESRTYDNWSLHCRSVESPEGHEGDFVEVFKVKASLLSEDQLVIGDVYRVYYDRYGRVCEFQHC